MKNKNLSLVMTALNVAGGLLLVSSFFVKDNDKAVKRRWIGLGALGLGWGVQLANTDFSKSGKAIK